MRCLIDNKFLAGDIGTWPLSTDYSLKTIPLEQFIHNIVTFSTFISYFHIISLMRPFQ